MDSDDDQLFDFEGELEHKDHSPGKEGSSALLPEDEQCSADTDIVAAWGTGESPRSRFQAGDTVVEEHAKGSDAAEREATANALMGTSMPISIPWTLKRKVVAPTLPDYKHNLSTFIPPHKLSQANPSYMEGSVPDLGAKPIRQRNEIFKKTGFLELGSTEGFAVSRVSTGGQDETSAALDHAVAARRHRSLGANMVVQMDSCLSSALTPVTEI